MSNINLVSDLFKDVHGFRPRGTLADDINAMSKEDFDRYFDGLVEELEVIIASDKRREEAALASFMIRLVGMMRDYNITMQRALVWDADGFGSPEDSADFAGFFDQQGFEHYLWKQGINYKEWATFVSVVKKEMDVTVEELDARIHNEA